MYAYLVEVCHRQNKEMSVCHKTCMFAWHFKKKGTCAIKSLLNGLCEGEDQNTFAKEALAKYGGEAHSSSYEIIDKVYRELLFSETDPPKSRDCLSGDCKTCGYQGWSKLVTRCPFGQVLECLDAYADPLTMQIYTAFLGFVDGTCDSPLPPEYR